MSSYDRSIRSRLIKASAVFGLLFAVGCSRAASDAVSLTSPSPLAAAVSINCQPPNAGRVLFDPLALGRVTVTNWSPCANDYTFILWRLLADGTQVNVSQMTRRLAPFEVAVFVVGLPSSVCSGALQQFQRDVYFGVSGDHLNQSDLNNAPLFADEHLWPVASCGPIPPASPICPAIPSLGAAEPFAVLASATVTNTGPTTVSGDLGVFPGAAVTGFPPGVVSPGTVHTADASANAGQAASLTAFNDVASQSCTADLTGQDLGGKILTPGTYCFSTSAQLTGPLVLNAAGNPNALFAFKIGSTLTTASASSVTLINGGRDCNVFWDVGSSATLGTATTFIGNILARASVTLTTGVRVSGRALAQTGAVTLDSNQITAPASCGCQ